MTLSLLNNRHQEVGLIIDIGSTSVASALVLFSEKEKPEVVFSRRTRTPIEKNWDRKKIFTALREALVNLINITLKEGAGKLHLDEKKLRDKKIKEIFCVFSSPWSSFQVKTLKAEEKEAHLVSKETLDSLIKKEVEEPLKPEYDLVERKIIQTKLNGYRTSNPLGQKAREIEVSIFEGLVHKEETKKIESLILPRLHGRVVFHSLSLMTVIAINELFETENHYLTVDITGETTEVNLVRDGLVVASYSFPRGRNDFIRKLAEEFGVETDIALSFIRMFYEKKTEENFRGRIERVVREAENSWLNNLAEAFKSFPKEFIPPKVFVLTDRELEYPFPPLIKKALGNASAKTSVEFLAGEILNRLLNFRDKIDPFLAIEAIAINRMRF